MSRPSAFSIMCLAATSVVAAAGWLGVRLDGDGEGIARPAGIVAPDDLAARRRAAWQPSPVPGPASASQAAPVAGAPSASAATDDARRRAAWRPSPVPTPRAAAAAPSAKPPAPAFPAPNPDRAALAAAPGPGLWQSFSHLVGVGQGVAPETPTSPSRGATSGFGVAPGPLADLRFSAYEDLFTSERLEAIYGSGNMPESRGEWHYHDLPSRAVGETHQLLVWTPPGYGTEDRDFPTLYLLHGAGSATANGADEWLGYALTEDLDRLIDSGFIEPMVVVLPYGAQGYWVDHADGGPRWSEYVTDEVVPFVDARFRTERSRERRAIGGLSMGGHGALQMAYRRPDLFSVAGAHSPTIRPFEDSPPFFGDARHFAAYDPLNLATTGTGAPAVTTWIDFGNEDAFGESNVRLRDALVAREAEVHFHVFEGEHEGWYWMGYLPEYLRFYSQALNAGSFTRDGAPRVEADSILLAASAIPQR